MSRRIALSPLSLTFIATTSLLSSCILPAPKASDGTDAPSWAGDDPGSGRKDSVDSVDPLDVDDDEDGFSENEGDCDDSRSATYPGAFESCNERDDDCDGQMDEGACDQCDDCIDTGMAFAYYNGAFEVTPADDGPHLTSFSAGIALRNGLEDTWFCENSAAYTEFGAAASMCPGCDWAFAVTIGETTRSPESCDDAAGWEYDPDIMDNDVSDFWFGSAYTDGVGFASNYTYVGAKEDYVLEDVVFFHFVNETYNGWYLLFYNWPDQGIVGVEGDASAATMTRHVIADGGYWYYVPYYRYL